MNRIVVVELDGASWNVIDPLIKQGKLPNIQRLVEDGSSGELLSDPPLISPRLWVSIFTGKNSKKHGIEFFGNSSSMVKCKRIWDIFNEQGFGVGVFGSFVTWPPYPVSGFMIPSLFALGAETYPPDYQFFQELTLRERQKNKPGASQNEHRRTPIYYVIKMKQHGVLFRTLCWAALQLLADRVKRNSADERYWKKALAHTKISTELFLHLYRRFQPVFATYHIHLCDALAHRYWKYYEPEKFHDIDPNLVKNFGRVIPNAYIEADKAIGQIMEAAKDATVVVVSDHGSTAMESSRISYRIHVDNFLTRLRLREDVVPANVGLMTFCYFRDKERMSRIAALLQNAIFSDTQEGVFDVFQEESLLGVRLSQRLWGREIDGCRTINLEESGACAFSELFLQQKMEVSGTHKKEGVLMMAGPHIKKGTRIPEATIFDITPTILALAGLPVAEDMDGRVLDGIIQEDFLKAHPVRRIKSYENGTAQVREEAASATYEQVEKQLKSLGYL